MKVPELKARLELKFPNFKWGLYEDHLGRIVFRGTCSEREEVRLQCNYLKNWSHADSLFIFGLDHQSDEYYLRTVEVSAPTFDEMVSKFHERLHARVEELEEALERQKTVAKLV